MTSQRATCWSITVNNPTEDDREALNIARQKGWKVMGQLEVGLKDGTPHYQLRLQTPQVRFSAVKKVFRRGHIEPAREPAALARYVTKEATRAGDLPEQQDKYPSLSKFWDLVFEFLNDETKEGLDYTEFEFDKFVFYREENQRMFEKTPLVFLDRAARHLIAQGYHVEGIAANPNTRSQWKLYAPSILERSYHAIKNRAVEHNHQNADDDSHSLGSNRSQELPQLSGIEVTEASSVSAGSEGSDQGSETSYE